MATFRVIAFLDTLAATWLRSDFVPSDKHRLYTMPHALDGGEIPELGAIKSGDLVGRIGLGGISGTAVFAAHGKYLVIGEPVVEDLSYKFDLGGGDGVS